jgi:hypothetical protein
MNIEGRFALAVLVLASLRHFGERPTPAQLVDAGWAFPAYRWCGR